MNTSLISYQFDEDTVRVVMIGDDPWWVANDVARVLGYTRQQEMVRNLDDDEKGVHFMHTPGGTQEMNVISESGLFAAILKSRKPEAKRFRRWVTGEVLPSIRRNGRYELPADPPSPDELAADIDAARLNATVGMVREARRLFGTRHAREVWIQRGLPAPVADAGASIESDPVLGLVRDYIADKPEPTRAEVVEGVGLDPDRLADVRRVTAALRFCGRVSWQVRRGHAVSKRWVQRSRVEG